MKFFSKRRNGLRLAIVTTSLAATAFTGVAIAQTSSNENSNEATILATKEIPHGTRYVDDNTLPEGVEVIIQEGRDGKQERIQVGEPGRLNGIVDFVSTEKELITIAPSDEVIRVGKNKDSVISGVDERVSEIEDKKKADIAKTEEKERVASREETARKVKEENASALVLGSSNPSGAIKLPQDITGGQSSIPTLPPLPIDSSATGVTSAAENRAFLASIVSGQELQCADAVVMKESGYVTTAENPSSGAYGVAQSLPPTKYATHGSDWKTNGKTQILWMKDYVDERYGSFCGALDWHHTHNWY